MAEENPLFEYSVASGRGETLGPLFFKRHGRLNLSNGKPFYVPAPPGS